MTSVSDWILPGTVVLIVMVAALPRIVRRFGRSLEIGDRLRIRGGYEHPPRWLQGKPAVYGRAVAFMPQSNGRAAVTVALDSPLLLDGTSYPFVLLRLRYTDARWKRSEIVHVELWAEAPSSIDTNAPDTPRHEWIESHAAYQVMP